MAESEKSRHRVTPKTHLVTRRRFTGHIEIAVWPAFVVATVFTIWGLGMVTQPDRFSATPAYGILLTMADIRIWGAFYLFAALLLGLYVLLIPIRTLGIVAHVISILLMIVWLFVFGVRWWSDPNTTIINFGSWFGFLCMLIRSATLVPVTSINDSEVP